MDLQEWVWELFGRVMINRLSLIILLFISLFALSYAFAVDNVITVFYERDIGSVNKKVFGNNFKSRDPSFKRPVYSISDYGSGMLDPKWDKPVKKVMDVAKEAGIPIVRYTVGNHWDWHNDIGQNREHFLFGLDEFMQTIKVIDAVIIFNTCVNILECREKRTSWINM